LAGEPRAARSQPDRPELVVVGADGRARLPFAEQALVRTLDLDGHQPVPHGVYAVGARARHVGQEAVSTLRTASHGWLSLHGVALGGRTGAIVGGAAPARVAPLLFLAAGLTPRERAVALAMVAGQSNAQIARDLGIQLFTVKDHAKRVFAKTRTSGRAELVARIQDHWP
jgi:DNA-binding CsgD family transcriptional regulator